MEIPERRLKVLTGKLKELAFLRPVLNKVMGVIP